MTIRRTFRLAFAFAAAVLVFGRAAAAWEAPYIAEGIARAIDQAKAARDVSSFGLRSGGFCLAGGFIEPGKEIRYQMRLTGGKEYLFVGAGDRDVKDLDVLIVDKKNESTFWEDAENDNTPWVYVAPEKTLDVVVRLILQDAPDGQMHFNVFIVLESGGLKGSLDILGKSAGELTEAIGALTGELDVEMDKAPDTICLMGAILKDGADAELTRQFAARANYLIVGLGDANAQDMDIVVSRGDEVVAHDVDNDKTPVVAIEALGKAESLKVKLNMFSANRPSFGIAAVLTAKKK